jgi:hypothetical protein
MRLAIRPALTSIVGRGGSNVDRSMPASFSCSSLSCPSALRSCAETTALPEPRQEAGGLAG